MKIVSLRRRLVCTIIDKVFIFLLFIIVSYLCCSGYPGGEFGIFSHTVELEYEKIESEKTIYQNNLDVKKYMEENGYGNYDFLVEDDEEYEHHKTALDVYNKYVLILIIVNLLYYLICEYILKASLGKKIMKCKIIKRNGGEIENREIFSRTGIMTALLLSAVIIQMSLNINAYITSILFFFILDFTVFTRQQSLVDKYSDTYVVKNR